MSCRISSPPMLVALSLGLATACSTPEPTPSVAPVLSAPSALARLPANPWSVSSDQDASEFGTSTASAGDVNGDGYDDVVVGAPAYAFHEGYGGRPIYAGRLYVYLGSESGPSTDPSWTFEASDGDGLGMAVASAGDVNGDGYDDVVAGSPGEDNTLGGNGRVHVWLGSATGLETTPSWTAEAVSDTLESSRYGHAVASAGDVNGDGYADVAVGAFIWDAGENNEGRTFVYHGSPTGLDTEPAWTAEGNQIQAFYGQSVASAGDVNADGYDDLLVGAPEFDDPEADEGRAELFLGSATGLGPVPAWTMGSDQPYAHLGRAVASAGDVNGDGYDDVVIGAPAFDVSPGLVGRALVFHGSATGLGTTASSSLDSPVDYGSYANAVSGAGDVNGDGYDDVVVGIPFLFDTQFEEGGALVYLGSPSGISSTPNWEVRSGEITLQLGTSVGSGDTNGDGYSDVLLGSNNVTLGWGAGPGRAMAYFGAAPHLEATGTCPGPMEIALVGYTPGTEVLVAHSSSTGTIPIPSGPCAGTITHLGTAGLRFVRRTVPASGDRILTPTTVPCGTAVQALDLSTCTVSNLLSL